MIRHVTDLTDAPCRIGIFVRLARGDVTISVEDDGRGIDEARLSEIREGLEGKVDWMSSRIGLANVHQRIRTLYGTSYGLSIDSGPKGTKVLLRLPGKSA